MKHLIPVGCICFGIAVGFCMQNDVPAVHAEGEATEASDGGEPKEYSGRLPNNFRKLGLFYKQKQEIYRVQTMYRAKIESLEARLNALEAERDRAVYAVLTDAQKEYFREIVGDGGDPILEAVDSEGAASEDEGDTPGEGGSEAATAVESVE